jgi:hypothetical protein
MCTSSEVNIFIYLSHSRQIHAGFKVREAGTVYFVHTAGQHCSWKSSGLVTSLLHFKRSEHQQWYFAPADEPKEIHNSCPTSQKQRRSVAHKRPTGSLNAITLQEPMVTLSTTSCKKNTNFCSQSTRMCFLWFSKQRNIIYLRCINRAGVGLLCGKNWI